MARPSRCWLIKSEPAVYGIVDLAREKSTGWSGVRNYQARNFMRDGMQVGDLVLFYHSNAEAVGVAGIARVARAGYPDPTAWDASSEAYDARSTRERPVWVQVDVTFVEQFRRFVPLAELKADASLAGMPLLQRGQRLSVQPVDPAHFARIRRLGRAAR